MGEWVKEVRGILYRPFDIRWTVYNSNVAVHRLERVMRHMLAGIRFHDLRCTFASLMLLAGIHPKIVSEMLGHSTVAFTLDVYSHVIKGLGKAAMKRLDEVLQPELAEMRAKLSYV